VRILRAGACNDAFFMGHGNKPFVGICVRK
jgi:hypothetical protein